MKREPVVGYAVIRVEPEIQGIVRGHDISVPVWQSVATKSADHLTTGISAVVYLKRVKNIIKHTRKPHVSVSSDYIEILKENHTKCTSLEALLKNCDKRINDKECSFQRCNILCLAERRISIIPSFNFKCNQLSFEYRE